jgi:hypothetical protein
MYHVARARTQKAKGLAMLNTAGLNVPYASLFQSEAELDGVSGYVAGFARPCPKRPRHGFLDSQRVSSRDELAEIIRRTLAVDPEGEVLLMPFIDARRSAILTPSQVTLGFGHDGATSGKAGAITLPLAHVHVPCYLREALQGTPYFESVLERGAHVPLFVQMRDGPAAPRPADSWIPTDVTVTRVLVPTEDLLAWETTAQSAQPGDVAHVPHGTMVCHAAVHCVLNKLPVVFRADAPRVGDTLRANADEAPAVFADDVADGLARGLLSQHMRGASAAMRAALLSVHHALAFTTTRDGARAFGGGVATLLRYSAACIFGELRHHWRGKKMLEEHAGIAKSSQTRDYIYEQAGTAYTAFRQHLYRALRCYRSTGWAGGYGGNAWARCTELLIALDEAAQQLIAAPNQATIAAVISAAHNVVNAAHNHGALLSKVIRSDEFQSAANCELSWTMQAAYNAADELDAARQGTFAMLLAPLRDDKTEPTGPPNGWLTQWIILARPHENGVRFQLIQPGLKVSKKKTGATVDHETRDFQHVQIPAGVMNINVTYASAAGTEARYFKVSTKQYGKLPACVRAWIKDSVLASESERSERREEE